MVLSRPRYSLGTISLFVEQAEPIPLVAHADGVIRVRGTRVTLDRVAQAFDRGATAEGIAQQYPTLALADVYAVLGYLLRHQAKVAVYLEPQASGHYPHNTNWLEEYEGFSWDCVCASNSTRGTC